MATSKVILGIRRRIDRHDFIYGIKRLYSLMNVGTCFTVLPILAGYLISKFISPWGVFIIWFGLLGFVVTAFLCALYALTRALEVTIYTTRKRYRRIAGAWVFFGLFSGGMLYGSYRLVCEICGFGW